MSGKKIIAVLGATGAQGGGLVKSILNDESGEFSVRALTRNANTEKAKALAKLGAEVIEVDLDGVVGLTNAFDNAYGVYAVTFYWEHMSPEKEKVHAHNIAKAAKHSNISHIIWSTLEDTRNWIPLTDNRMPSIGNYKVPHFDAKGESDNFFKELNLPVTYLLTSFYWDNFIYFGMAPKAGPDGKLALTLPMGDKKLPGIAAADIGKAAYGIFKRGNEFIGKKVGISGGHLTGNEMAESFSKVFGQQVVYNNIPFDVYRSFGFPGADDLGNMFQFKHDFEEYYCGARSLQFSKSLNPELQSFDQWLAANKDKITLD